MRAALGIFVFMAGLAAISYFWAQAWADRKALQSAAEICAPYGVYEVDTSDYFGARIDCNDAEYVLPFTEGGGPVDREVDMDFDEDVVIVTGEGE